MNRSLRRFAIPIVFIFALGLTSPTAGFAATERAGLRWSDWLGFLSNLWAPQGCSVEPVGGCNASAAPRETGCSLEPVGRCIDASTPAPRDEGCVIEPVGRCAK